MNAFIQGEYEREYERKYEREYEGEYERRKECNLDPDSSNIDPDSSNIIFVESLQGELSNESPKFYSK